MGAESATPPVPQDQKKPSLNRVKDDFSFVLILRIRLEETENNFARCLFKSYCCPCGGHYHSSGHPLETEA